MKRLSTRLAMKDGYSAETFRNTIVEWLKAGPPTRGVGELFETEDFANPKTISAGYCTLETFHLTKEKTDYEACKLTHIYREQTWVTEIILEVKPSNPKVYFNIECLGDITRFTEIPTVRTDVIRTFIKSGWVKENCLPITAEPIILNREAVEVLVSAIKGSYEGSLPLVYVSKLFDSTGYEVDETQLAKDLAGIAIVIVEENDTYLDELKERTNRQNPFNGHIGIYFPYINRPKIYRTTNRRWQGSLDAEIINETGDYTTAQTDIDNVGWGRLHGEILTYRAQESEELLNETINENGTLEEQLKEAKEKLHRAVMENKNLVERNEMLLQALNSRDNGLKIITAAPIDEFFNNEQYDLVVNILEKAFQTIEKDSRSHELLEGILEVNPLSGQGKIIDETIKKILSKGENPKDRDLAELKAIGFEVISDNNHYRLLYKGNDKYTITLYKTPSDTRSGKNMVSDIIKTISVYK